MFDRITEKGSGGKIYGAQVLKAGSEKSLYIFIPYAGCSQKKKCLFCGVQEQKNAKLAINADFGNETFLKIKKYIEIFRPDSAVLYSGGNILRPSEMFSKTVLADVPDCEDLVSVLESVCKCRDEIKSGVLFKTGFREEDVKNMIRIPYVSDNLNLEEIFKRFESFDQTQDLKALI